MTDERTNQIYRCSNCGNLVEMLETGKGQLNCCGRLMSWQEEGAVDASREKHVPVVKRTGGGFKVTVGNVAHPMEEKHDIQFIELHAGDRILRKKLSPGQPPEAEFDIDADEAFAREYCNLHGLWRS